MIIKFLELRDEGTRIAAVAIRLTPDNEAQRAILASAGYGRLPSEQAEYVVLLDAHYWNGSYNPYSQRSTTHHHAHLWIREHFDELKDGDVVDVEFILGKRTAPKNSEIQAVY